MKYFKIIDSKTIYTKTKHITLVQNELYTLTEFKKIHQAFGLTKGEDYIIVDIPKNRTGFFFGARIELKGGEK